MIDNVESAWHVYAALKQYQDKEPSLHDDLLFQQAINEAHSYWAALFMVQP